MLELNYYYLKLSKIKILTLQIKKLYSNYEYFFNNSVFSCDALLLRRFLIMEGIHLKIYIHQQ